MFIINILYTHPRDLTIEPFKMCRLLLIFLLELVGFFHNRSVLWDQKVSVSLVDLQFLDDPEKEHKHNTSWLLLAAVYTRMLLFQSRKTNPFLIFAILDLEGENAVYPFHGYTTTYGHLMWSYRRQYYKPSRKQSINRMAYRQQLTIKMLPWFSFLYLLGIGCNASNWNINIHNGNIICKKQKSSKDRRTEMMPRDSKAESDKSNIWKRYICRNKIFLLTK